MYQGGFHDVHALFYIVVHSVHARCLIKCFLGIFSLIWTPISTKLWGFSCFLTRIMFGSLVVYLTHLALHVHISMLWSCIAHSHLLHTPLLPLSCIGLHLISSSQYVMITLCFVAICFVFCLNFTLQHLAPLMHHSPCSYLYFLPSFLLNPLSIHDKKGESILQSNIPESFVISI